MKTNSQKTEAQEKQDKAKAILAVKFATYKENSLMFWHSLTIASEKES